MMPISEIHEGDMFAKVYLQTAIMLGYIDEDRYRSWRDKRKVDHAKEAADD